MVQCRERYRGLSYAADAENGETCTGAGMIAEGGDGETKLPISTK